MKPHEKMKHHLEEHAKHADMAKKHAHHAKKAAMSMKHEDKKEDMKMLKAKVKKDCMK